MSRKKIPYATYTHVDKLPERVRSTSTLMPPPPKEGSSIEEWRRWAMESGDVLYNWAKEDTARHSK